MPQVSIEARLIRALIEIPRGCWFILYEDDTMTLVDDSLAKQLAAKRPRKSANGTATPPAGLTPSMHAVLLEVARHKRPMPAGKLNDSGQLSRLKALGYTANANMKWSITPAGQSLINPEPTND